MGGPKSTAQRLEGKGARKDGRSSSAMKPELFARGERARRSGKPTNFNGAVENLEPLSAHAASTSPIEKHMVNAQSLSARRKSASSFLQPDQFISELKVKIGTGNRSELSLNDSPDSARSTHSIRSSNEPRNEAAALEPPPPRLRKSVKPSLSNGKSDGAQPVSRGSHVAEKRETMSRRPEINGRRAPTSRLETGVESFCEPAHAVPTLELSFEGKPAPAPAHLRARTGTGMGHSANSAAQPSLGRSSEGTLSAFFTPELRKSSLQGRGGSFNGVSPALQRVQATSALLGNPCSPASMREKLVRSASSRNESSSCGNDARTVHSFHAGMSAKPHAQVIQSQPMKSSHVEGNSTKPAGRLRRMLHWGASKTGLEVLKTLERKLGKKSSKVSSGSKNEKATDGQESSKAEQQMEAKIEVEREIREVGDPVEKIDLEPLDDGNWSPAHSASSVNTTYSDISSKSHSYKNTHSKKNAKSEVVKSKLWLLRVHHKLQGRASKESDDDVVFQGVRGATLHGIPDATFKDVEKKALSGSARFNGERNVISKLVAKHKRNSTWDAGKLSPNDHLFSPKQPRLLKSDAHLLLAPPKKLTGHPRETEFQRRRGKPSTFSPQSGSSPLEVTDRSPSPRTVSTPVAQSATSGGGSRPKSQTTTPTRTRPGKTQQGVALPALPSSGTFLQTAALMLTSPGRTESETSPKSAMVSPARSEVGTPPLSPGALPTSPRSSFGSFRGFNSPLPLPIRVGTVGPQSSPSSPIYAASQSPGRFASAPTGDGTQSTPTSPGLYAPSPGWAGMQSPTSPRASSTSPDVKATSADGAKFQDSRIAGLDATSRSSRRGQGANVEETFFLANSSFDSTSSSNSSAVPASNVKRSETRGAQQGTRVRSLSASHVRSASVVGQNGVHGPKAGSMSDERESSDKHKVGNGNALALLASPRPPAVSFEQIVAGRGRSPPTDNTLMKFFFKCREIEHLNKFLAVQKKRFLESYNTDSEKCFHMILSEAGQGLSSMVSTLCTAWLLENTKASASGKWHPIPVLNMCRKEMWQHRDAAWLFHVCGVEASSVLFLDEITSGNESVVAGRVKQAVAGQDILVTKDEVASSCSIVSEKFRQEAPKLLQARYMKTLLLAGILVDTKNLSTGSSRDKQQATILLVGAGSLGRNGFYKHLVNIRDESYETSFIKEMYGDSNALTGEKSIRRAPGLERPNGEKTERPPLSTPAPLRPPPLAISNVPSEDSAPISPSPPAKPIALLTRKSEPEVELSRESEVETKPSGKPEVETKPSRKSASEAMNDDASKVSSNKKEGAPQNSKSSLALFRFRNRSSAQ